MTGMFERQQSLKLEIPESVWVVGAGGVGYWTAYTLAMGGVPRIYIFDHDTLGESNLNRVPHPRAAVGRNKASALESKIQEVRPDCLCVGLPVRWAPKSVVSLQPPEWLVATTDTLASRRACGEWAREKGVKYLEAAAEGEWGSVAGEPAEWATEDEVNPGYASVPVWAGPVMIAGVLAAMHVLHGQVPLADVTRMGWTPEGKVGFLSR